MEPKKTDSETVEHLVGMGASQELIAHKLKCTVRELRRNFKAELKLGKEEANVQVTEFLFNQAKNGSVPATMNWLKERAGWSGVVATPTDTSPARVIVRGQDADGQVQTLTTGDTTEPPEIA